MGSSFQVGVRNTLVRDDFSREEQLSEAGREAYYWTWVVRVSHRTLLHSKKIESISGQMLGSNSAWDGVKSA